MAKTRVIGLDIGTTAVRAAQLEFGAADRGKGQPTLAALRRGRRCRSAPCATVRSTDQATVTQAIKQLWATYKFESKDVVIGVGNQRVVVRDLALPYMPLPQLRASLPFQVQELLPDVHGRGAARLLPDGRGHRPSRDGWSRDCSSPRVRDTVSANVMAVESAGLRATMVDLNAFALLRGMAAAIWRSARRDRRHRRTRHRRDDRRPRRPAVRPHAAERRPGRDRRDRRG